MLINYLQHVVKLVSAFNYDFKALTPWSEMDGENEIIILVHSF